jgi:DNA-directed RNA polymerase specialized sigma24 family protein
MSNASAAESLAAAVDGDVRAFAHVIREFAGPLVQLLTRVEGDHKTAAALTRRAFVAAWKHRDGIGHPRRFTLTLYRFALIRSRAAGGRQYAARSADLSALADPALAVIDELPPRQRAVVLLRVWEGYSFDDIAFVLAISEGFARAEMSGALKALRDSFRHTR